MIILFISTSTLYSKEFKYLARSPRALLMGDAFTAVADDEYTLFYNPAAMGRHRGVHISPINPSIALPNVLSVDVKNLKIGIDGKYDNWPKKPAEITSRIIGTPIHFGTLLNPTLKFENFAFTWINSSKTNLSLENSIHPSLEIDYRYDRGFILGGAIPLTGKGVKEAPSKLSVGFSFKKISRSALNQNFDLFGTELLEIIENTDGLDSIKSALGYSKGSAWGWDLGLEQVFKSGNSSVVLGFSVLDIGDTNFKKDEGSAEIPVQKMSTNFGIAFNQDHGFFDYTFSSDLSPITATQTDFFTKLKLGFRAAIPGLELLMGINGGYWSYGLGIDLFIVKLTVGFYGIEAGREFKDVEAKRMSLTVSLLDLSFEP